MSSVGGQMESRPSGYVAKDTAWQSARAEIFRSQRQTHAQTVSVKKKKEKIIQDLQGYKFTAVN